MRQLLKKLVAERAMGDYSRRWSFDPQIPMRVAYQQKSEQLLGWLVVTSSWIEMRAFRKGAEILYGDEAGFHRQEFRQRSFSQKRANTICNHNRFEIFSECCFRPSRFRDNKVHDLFFKPELQGIPKIFSNLVKSANCK